MSYEENSPSSINKTPKKVILKGGSITLSEPKKGSSWDFSGGACEGCFYVSIAVIIGCIIIGFIVWQLIMLGQILGVILGIITFSSLLVILILYFRATGVEGDPQLAFKLRVVATVLFVAFLIEAIHTIVFFWTPILHPVVSQLFAQANWTVDSGFVMICVIGFFLVIIGAFFSIPVCLWTSICRNSKEAKEITPKVVQPPATVDEKIHPKKCPVCGMKLSGIEKFCSYCGAAISK